MKLNKKIMGFIWLLFVPFVVLASSGDSIIGVALFIEAFVTIHMTVFVILPLSRLLPLEDSSKAFWMLFISRVVFLLFCDFFVTPNVFILDFLSVFIGAFIVVPIAAVAKRKDKIDNSSKVNDLILDNNDVQRTPLVSSISDEEIKVSEKKNEEVIREAIKNLKCPKCNEKLRPIDKFCPNCGVDVKKEVEFQINNAGKQAPIIKKDYVLPTSFSNIYNSSENNILDEYIKIELENQKIDLNTNLMPLSTLKRKKVLSIIFSILVFIYISMIFFHFPLLTYIIGIIILIVFFVISRKFNLVKMIAKEIKARPTEKMDNIIINIVNSLTDDNLLTFKICSFLVAVFLPLMIFMTPKIFYEKQDDGYAVRFYAYGLLNYKSATIPEEHNGKKVIALRGNTFSNMYFLEKVTLPDTIKEIRGQAFKYDWKLTEVNMPKSLEYLGGGAFYNCISLKKISLPDTLTYMGGETFYNATSLEYVKLSRNLTEIRGNTFENCYSLKEIAIPDKVTRIGGHAFYGNQSLSKVTLTENSKLTEIGSSAFRQCYKLKTITIPIHTTVNDRAFKESPTKVSRFK
ncbi:uncharacterized protein BN817_00488 [Mycoplasma sp. CAG:956]|nr:uncharacterized protein BN817_00488 [Mycoplasma sp. CAG:956]